MESGEGIVLIGGGVASVAAATELRARDYRGAITLVTRELDPPYRRPDISKHLLIGEDRDLRVVPDEWWSEHDVGLLTRSAVVSMDLAERSIRLANKQELRFDKALLATGAMVRRLPLPGAALKGVHYLRAPMNGHGVYADLPSPGKSVVLIGGSFIAVEAAAALTAAGHHCTMVMPEERCLERSFGGEIASFVDGLLRSHGIEMVCGVEPTALEGDGHVTGVRTSDGRVVPADLVIIGVGAVPDAKLARQAGLDIGATGGIACDAMLQTSDPAVYAAGDVCEYDSLLHGRPVRIEHERHAEAQGRTAAANMLGAEQPHVEVPYFWTDLADWATLEYVGLGADHDRELVTGSVPDRKFTVWQFRGADLIGAVCCGTPTDLAVARQALATGGRVGVPTIG